MARCAAALALLTVLWALPTAHAQTGVCAIGSAEAEIEGGDVRARLYTLGSLFWKDLVGGPYAVPKDSGLSPLYTLNLWVGGRVDGAPRFAGASFGTSEFWPGPLAEDGTTTPERCSAFDRIWHVTVADIEAYAAGGPPARDLAEWPIAQGAPFFVDADGDGRRGPAEPRRALGTGDAGYSPEFGAGAAIDLAAGERPDLIGDEGAWWVLNDAGGPHPWSGGESLRVEVQVLAAAFTDADPALQQATVFSYTIVNRGTEPIEDARVSFYADTDIGGNNDDYAATDPDRGLAIGYNADDVDIGFNGYEDEPPALGIDLLSGAESGLVTNKNSGPTDDPVGADDALGARFLQLAIWKDGTPLTVGGTGYNPGSGDVTSWGFPGAVRDLAFWTEEQPLPGASATRPADRRVILTAPPRTLAPGASTTVDLALLFAEAPPGGTRLESVVRVKDISDAVQAAYDGADSRGGLAGLAALRTASVTYTPPPSVPAPVALLAPADGADLDDDEPDTITFEWDAVPGASRYLLEVSDDPTFTTAVSRVQTPAASATLLARDLPEEVDVSYWRVTASNWGGASAPSAARSYAYRIYRPDLLSVVAVANAAGSLDPPVPAVASFAGYPADHSPGPEQQTAEATWFLSAFGTGTYDEFLAAAFPNDNAKRFFPSVYEIRFTGTSLALRDGFEGQTGDPVEVPFELWDLGLDTPGDPSDDVRLIPYILDLDRDGTYSLSTRDSNLSSRANDPETDPVSWYAPTDRTPGEAGYLAYENGGALNPDAVGGELLALQTFVGWDLGEAPPYAASHPEAGTIIRLTTNAPSRPTAAASGPEPGLSLAAFPNPIRGGIGRVTYTLATPGTIHVRLVDVLGREVAVLADGDRTAGTHRAALDASRLASGVYVVELRSGDARATRTITVTR